MSNGKIKQSSTRAQPPQLDAYCAARGLDRDAFVDHPAYALTSQFTDEWDQIAFDPNGETYPLEHFEPLVREVFGRVKYS